MLLEDDLEQREEELSGTFEEKEDLEHWISTSTHYNHESVSFRYNKVLLRSQNLTDLTSTGDIGIVEEEGVEENEFESGWTVLHNKLVDHFYRQWVTRTLEWTGCQQPVREDRVIRMMENRRSSTVDN